jgi:FAD/FMN-containing dehydrogenase
VADRGTDWLVRQLLDVVGPAGVVTEAEAQAPYTRDWLGKWQGRVPVVVRPASTEQTAAVVRICREAHTPIVTQGGNTGMSGGATPDASGAQVIVSTTRMNRVRAVDPVNNTLTVEAGVILAQAQDAAREAGRFFPLSLGAEGSCTIGGNLATNAGGIAVLRYGNMRDLVLGLEVVLPDGRTWNGLRGLRKDNTGYDLRGLFVGSEGTLGIITAAVLKLFPQPAARATAWVTAASLDALLALLQRARSRCGERLVAFEMLTDAALQLVLRHLPDTRAPIEEASPFHALIELSDTEPAGLAELLEQVLADAMEAGLVGEAVIAANQAQVQALWKLRESISLAQVRAGPVVKHDVALPISALPAFCAEAGAAVAATGLDGQVINFGHLGDGNLHYNVLLPAGLDHDAIKDATQRLNRAVHDLVVRHTGSISAEHGVGQLRRDELRHYKSAVEMDLMLAIKRALDPNLIMNPGKLL